MVRYIEVKKYSILCVLCVLCVRLFASGTGETTAPTINNPEWTIAVTAFDVSALPNDRKIIGDAIVRQIAGLLGGLETRKRSEAEMAYYQGVAKEAALKAAAKNIADKQGQKDALIFKGDNQWNYTSQVNKLNTEMETLREKYNEVLQTVPPVAENPLIKISQDNINGIYPPPPAENEEAAFCRKNKLDAFVQGSVSLYHERYLLEVSFYELFSGAYIMNDTILFSTVEQEKAVGEVSDALMTVVDGKKRELETNALAMQPVKPYPVMIGTEDGEAAKLYQGSLYIGETPVSVDFNNKEPAFVSLQGADEAKRDVIVFPDAQNLNLKLTPFDQQEKSEPYRKKFYDSWARFWITLPLSILFHGYSTSLIESSVAAVDYRDYQWAQLSFYLDGILMGVAVAFGVESITRYGVYLYKADKNAPDVIGAGNGS